MTEETGAVVPESLEGELELAHIFFIGVSAELERFGPPTNLRMSVNTSYAVRDSRVLYRIIADCMLRGDVAGDDAGADDVDLPTEEGTVDSHDLATINVKLVCEYRKPVSMPEPPVKLLEDFGERAVLKEAYPYLREAISSMVSRLGLPGIPVGLLADGETLPNTVHVRSAK